MKKTDYICTLVRTKELGMLTQIYNGQVLTPEGWIKGGSVIIEDSRIKEVSKSSRLLDGMDKAIDAHNMYVVPGGIDLHCHGGGGSDFQECTREAFETAAITHLEPRCPRSSAFPTPTSIGTSSKILTA